MATPKKRISSRKHPPRNCKHCGVIFIPSDARQHFCIPQHRIDYNNDLRKGKAGPVKALNDKLLKNEKILKKVTETLIRLNQEFVGIDILEYEGFDFDVSSSTDINKKKGTIVHWCFSYGLEGNDKDKTTFIIWKKQ